MRFSRTAPSPRYTSLVELYRDMHLHGERFRGIEPDKTFAGKSLRPHLPTIKALVERTGARTILDYGSGKGRLYGKALEIEGAGHWDSVAQYWGVERVTCYDPAFPPFSELPAGRFHGVVSTDVLEHCPEEDVEWIVHEMFSFAERFLFATIACYPARKRLPNGENAHCTIRPAEWWQAILAAAARTRPGVFWEAHVVREGPDGRHQGLRLGTAA